MHITSMYYTVYECICIYDSCCVIFYHSQHLRLLRIFKYNNNNDNNDVIMPIIITISSSEPCHHYYTDIRGLYS